MELLYLSVGEDSVFVPVADVVDGNYPSMLPSWPAEGGALTDNPLVVPDYFTPDFGLIGRFESMLTIPQSKHFLVKGSRAPVFSVGYALISEKTVKVFRSEDEGQGYTGVDVWSSH